MTQKLYVLIHLTIISLIPIVIGLSMEMIPIDSPQLKMLPEHLSARERHQHLANISLSRAYKISRRHSLSTLNYFSAPLEEVHSNYFVTSLVIGTGEGVHTPYLLLDTGATETWVQCEGCNPCIESKYKSFDYKNSTNFQRMTTMDELCFPKLDYQASCGFDITYPNNSRVRGFVATDDFSFKNSKTQFMDVYKGLAFGCGLVNENFKFGVNTGPSNAITGIHGLAPGTRSFINQLDDHIRGRFSYCIPSWTESEYTRSTMYFGDEAQIKGDDTRKVQVISIDTEVRYHLYLNGISVDGKRLSIDPSIFRLDPIRLDTGFIIDSGVPYTVLAKNAFDPVRDEIVKFFDMKYGWKPDGRPTGEFQLCYTGHYPEDQFGFPSVTLHFSYKGEATEVDMVLDKDHMFMKFTGKGFCMVVLQTNDTGPSILGAFQQANFNILYDVSERVLQFVPQRCNEGM